MADKKIVVTGKTLAVGVGILVIISFFIIGITKISARKSTEGNEAVGDGPFQVVKVSTSGLNYIFEPSTVQTGKIKLVFDANNMQGCSRGFFMDQLKIRKMVTSSDDAVTVNINQPGTYTAHCSMNMYKGSLTVR